MRSALHNRTATLYTLTDNILCHLLFIGLKLLLRLSRMTAAMLVTIVWLLVRLVSLLMMLSPTAVAAWLDIHFYPPLIRFGFVSHSFLPTQSLYCRFYFLDMTRTVVTFADNDVEDGLMLFLHCSDTCFEPTFSFMYELTMQVDLICSYSVSSIVLSENVIGRLLVQFRHGLVIAFVVSLASFVSQVIVRAFNFCVTAMLIRWTRGS